MTKIEMSPTCTASSSWSASPSTSTRHSRPSTAPGSRPTSRPAPAVRRSSTSSSRSSPRPVHCGRPTRWRWTRWFGSRCWRCSATGRSPPRLSHRAVASPTWLPGRSRPPRRPHWCAPATRSASRSDRGSRAPSCTRSATASDFDELTVFGALLVDLYTVFTRPGVRYLSGFFGPAERFLVDSRRRRGVRPCRLPPLLPHRRAALAACGRHGRAPRPTPTADAACRCTPARPSTRSTGPAPTRIACWSSRPTRSSRGRSGSARAPPSRPRRRDRRARRVATATRSSCPTPSRPTSTAPSPSTSARSSPTARRCRPASAAIPSTVVRLLAERRRRRLRHPLRDVHHRAHAAAPGRQGHQRQQGSVRRHVGHHVRGRHRRALRVARREPRRARSSRSTSSTRPSVIARNRTMVTINGALTVDL